MPCSICQPSQLGIAWDGDQPLGTAWQSGVRSCTFPSFTAASMACVAFLWYCWYLQELIQLCQRMEALGAAPVLDDGLVGGNAGLLVVSRPAHTSTQTKGRATPTEALVQWAGSPCSSKNMGEATVATTYYVLNNCQYRAVSGSFSSMRSRWVVLVCSTLLQTRAK